MTTMKLQSLAILIPVGLLGMASYPQAAAPPPDAEQCTIAAAEQPSALVQHAEVFTLTNQGEAPMAIHTEASPAHLLVQAPPVHFASLMDFFSSEQECCGGSGGWNSPFVYYIAGALLLVAASLFYWRRHRSHHAASH